MKGLLNNPYIYIYIWIYIPICSQISASISAGSPKIAPPVPLRVLLPSASVAYEALLLPSTAVKELLMKMCEARVFGQWFRFSVVFGSQQLSSTTQLGSLQPSLQDNFY